ncbi:MAG: M20/M25/M40 family metallo-hydrolase, partial [Bacteroidota bacterium]
MTKKGSGTSLLFAMVFLSVAGSSAEQVDTAAVARIIDEGTNRSRVMESLGWLTDIFGPRLSWSPGFQKAGEWTMETLREWGLENVHREQWTPLGRGWTLERYTAHVTTPTPFPLISYPKAWSPGTPGTVSGELIYLDARTDSALESYEGRLAGKFVLLSEPVNVKPPFEPLATREVDSSLLAYANADPDLEPRSRRPSRFSGWVGRRMMQRKKLQLCRDEGAAGLLTVSRRDGGNVMVQSATIPDHPDTPYTSRRQAFETDPESTLPQVTVAAEHYNRLVRLLQKGENPRLEMSLEVAWTEPDSGFNVIGEIPGSDLRDEVVMIGAHLDSWHGGTGTVDNAVGVAACMEAVRILKALDLQPRRTIRIALWGGEEQGLLGSRAYVKRHLGERMRTPATDSAEAGIPTRYKPDAEKFSIYINQDLGSGRIRGVLMNRNEALRPILRAWLTPFHKMNASTLTLNGTTNSDHASFEAINITNIEFLQDKLDYFTRAYHGTMDLYERALEEDLKQA